MKRIIFCMLLGIMGICIVGASGIKEYNYNIISVKSNDRLDAKFFLLGGGYIQQKRYYFTYAVMPNGGMRFLTLPADSTTIFESNKIKPFVHIWIDAPSEECVFTHIQAHYPKIELHVPEETIIREFKIEP